MAEPMAEGARYDLIREGAGSNWLTYAGDYAAHRHSPLTQITTSNVASMVSAWVYRIDGATHLEATPLVYDGVMYVTNSNEVHALDARTGRPIWKYRDEQAKRSDVNRGVAILGDRVFFVTSDAHLVALNRKTGGPLWDREYADTSRGAFATLAPMALKDRVIVGVSGGDTGVRGFIAAFSAATGEELWRFWTVPAKGEPGAETWGQLGPEWGGAATWLNGTYDPDLNVLYWTTGNPWPDFYGGARRGDNLYSDSIAGAGRRHRQAEMVFPIYAARHARLGCAGLARAARLRVRRPSPQASAARQPQRLLLCARPDHGRISARHALRRAD